MTNETGTNNGNDYCHSFFAKSLEEAKKKYDTYLEKCPFKTWLYEEVEG